MKTNAAQTTGRDMTLNKSACFFTFEQIKEANQKAGHHYFEPDTLRFFRSRICGGRPFPAAKGGAYFVTSEKLVGSDGYEKDRMYTVRYAAPDGVCETAEGTKFQQFAYRETALNYARHLAAGK
jgi:hypothetical protein